MPIILILMFELQSSIENIKYTKEVFDSTNFNKVSIDNVFFGSNKNIELVEAFINNNICDLYSPSLCNYDVENAIYTFNEINFLPPTTYILFNSEINGMVHYGFYKARNEEIYIIEEYGNLIINYYSPEKCKFLSI